MGRYTARATQLAKMVSKMMVSKGLALGLRRAPRVVSGMCKVEEKSLLKASLQIIIITVMIRDSQAMQ